MTISTSGGMVRRGKIQTHGDTPINRATADTDIGAVGRIGMPSLPWLFHFKSVGAEVFHLSELERGKSRLTIPVAPQSH